MPVPSSKARLSLAGSGMLDCLFLAVSIDADPERSVGWLKQGRRRHSRLIFYDQLFPCSLHFKCQLDTDK